jgi:hypothetical protein
MRMLAAACVVVLVLTGALAATARADGDPASDFLISQKVFFPFDAKFSKAEQSQLAAVVEAANKADYHIRVALIATQYDMVSVTSLYLKPRPYARFLGAELKFIYKERLLVVMPNGLGFNQPGQTGEAEYKTLSGIRVGPGNAGLVDAARRAVLRLSAADGVTFRVPATASVSGSSQRWRFVVAAAIVVVLAAVIGALAFRRRAGRWPSRP